MGHVSPAPLVSSYSPFSYLALPPMFFSGAGKLYQLSQKLGWRKIFALSLLHVVQAISPLQPSEVQKVVSVWNMLTVVLEDMNSVIADLVEAGRSCTFYLEGITRYT